MRRELLGQHVKTANGFYTLGRVYFKMGDFSSAVEAFQKASDMRSNLLGDSKDMALSYHRLGKAQSGMGDLNGVCWKVKRGTVNNLREMSEASKRHFPFPRL